VVTNTNKNNKKVSSNVENSNLNICFKLG